MITDPLDFFAGARVISELQAMEQLPDDVISRGNRERVRVGSS